MGRNNRDRDTVVLMDMGVGVDMGPDMEGVVDMGAGAIMAVVAMGIMGMGITGVIRFLPG